VTNSVDELWLRSLQKLTGHVSHDLKGALNGVSVNLEVVRARSERDSSTGKDVHKFAVTAAEQLAVVIRANTALLGLGRLPRGPVEVSSVAKQVTALLTDLTSAGRTRFEVYIEGGLSAETSAPLSVVRLALTETLMAAASGSGEISVRVAGLPSPVVHVSPARHLDLSPELTAALKDAGIRIDMDGHGISMYLPGPAELPTEDA
jgi:hypothetical protein